MTRQEHLDWCKQRAIEYVDRGDMKNAFASMMSDIRKHKETSNHPAINVGMQMLMSGKLSNAEDMRKFINGFN
jgi:hypothetical protein